MHSGDKEILCFYEHNVLVNKTFDAPNVCTVHTQPMLLDKHIIVLTTTLAEIIHIHNTFLHYQSIHSHNHFDFPLKKSFSHYTAC